MNAVSMLAGFALFGLLVLPANGQKQRQRTGSRVPADLALSGISNPPGGGWLTQGERTVTPHVILPDFILAPGMARDDTIVQSGDIGELGEVTILLDPFDDQLGTRRLDFVQIDLYSGMFGGFATSGIGGQVQVRATHDQDYFLGNSFLAGTRIVFRDTLTNDFAAAFSFFLSDTDEDFISQPHKLEPWIGTGQISLTSIGTLDWNIQPPAGLLDFGAGLTANYTVTYHYTVLDCSADLNGDGIVNVLDLRAVVAAFGNLGGPEDINQDGIVNARDLREVVGAFGSCP